MVKEVDYPVLRCLAQEDGAQSAYQIRAKTGFDHRDVHISLRGLLESKLIERAEKTAGHTTYRLTREGKTMIGKETGTECR